MNPDLRHRVRCPQPTPTATPSRALPGVTVHRCPACRAVALIARKETA